MDHQDDQFNKERSPSSVKDVKDIILASSKSILGKVLSPTKEKFAKENVSREKVFKHLLNNLSMILNETYQRKHIYFDN